MLVRSSVLIPTLLLLSSFATRGDEPAKPGPNSDKEPVAEKFSLRGVHASSTQSR